jgi:pimeloyl-ACP methyl ester carboxylesterase
MLPFKSLLASFFGAAILATSACALAAEKYVTFTVESQKVVGTLVLPDRVHRPPVVLMLHGFTGTRDEWKSPFVPEGLFGRAAAVLAQKGIASLRIDFRGSGESEGRFEDMTVESEIKDALAALDYLADGHEVNGRKISVLGMSLGGIVTTAVAGRARHEVKSVALWNPGINPPAAFMTMFGIKAIQDGAASGDQPLTIPFGAGSVTLKGGFFRSLFSVVPAAELERYAGPVFLAVGTNDSIVWPQPVAAEALLSYHRGHHELWTRPVDHGFNLMVNSLTVDELIDKTASFLLKTQSR